jgi:hypothetical protein
MTYNKIFLCVGGSFYLLMASLPAVAPPLLLAVSLDLLPIIGHPRSPLKHILITRQRGINTLLT